MCTLITTNAMLSFDKKNTYYICKNVFRPSQILYHDEVSSELTELAPQKIGVIFVLLDTYRVISKLFMISSSHPRE